MKISPRWSESGELPVPPPDPAARRGIPIRFGGGGLLVLVFVLAVAAEDARALRLELRGDRLTLLARDVPLESVLAMFADRLGVEVHGRPAESRQVHFEFEAVPVVDALQRLLDRESFTLTYAASGALRSIALHGRLRTPPREEDSGLAPPPAAAAASAAGAERPAEIVVGQPMLGSLPQGALPEQRAAIRAAATGTMLEALMQDEAFLERLRANTGEQPEEFLARLATSAPSEDVRAGAAAALENLRLQRAGQRPSPELHPGAPAPGPPVVAGRARRRRGRDASEGRAAPRHDRRRQDAS